MGESADALLVALTTCPAPARAALATTFSSWAGTAGLTRTTALTPFIASSMLAGTSRSPAATSAPASASAFTAAFAGSRTSTRTGSVPLPQQADGFGADLPGRRHKDHGEPLCFTHNGLQTPLWQARNGLSNPEHWYRGEVGEEAGRPRLTPKGERTRARIVEAAARLIYERGVAGTTLDDVRSAAGVSGSQLTHYFAGKDELVRAVVGYQAGTVTGNQRQADLGTPEGLQAWRDMLVAQVQEQPRARAAARSARSPGSSPRPTRRPAP